jgi:hypothetical protein
VSRHLFEADRPGHHVVIGYDRPCNEFFATVYAPANRGDAPDDGDVMQWIPGEATPEAVIEQLRPYVELPDWIVAILRNEQRIGEVNTLHDHRGWKPGRAGTKARV